MWIANRKRREFTNVQTGMRIEITDHAVLIWLLSTSMTPSYLGKVHGHDSAEQIYKNIRGYLTARDLLLMEFEE